MARHSSPQGRHALQPRPEPVHRRSVPEPGAHRALNVFAPVRRRVAAVAVAGGALSLTGTAAAAWVEAAQAPEPADAALAAVPAGRTVALAAEAQQVAGSTAVLAPPPALDPAALVSSTAAAGTVAARPGRSAAPARPTDADQPARTPEPTRIPEPARTDDSGDAARRADAKRSAEADRRAVPHGGMRADDRSSDSDSDSDSADDRNADTEDGGSDDASSDDASSDDTSSDDTSSDDTSDGGDTAATVPPADGGLSAPGLVPSTGGATASRFPAELIDPKNWYLTLPTGKQGDPDIVEGSKLASYSSRFFALNQARDGVVFTANAGGATTSGSHFPRSELREMNGSEKASWDGRKGRHTMEIVEAITETPTVKPDVIAGQIHATTDDLMQIHLSGTKLRVKYADGQKFADLDPDYRLGTMFAIKIESAGGRVKVWYNGALKADLPISSATSYFKAGVYTNSNTSKGDKATEDGQVVIRSLTVRHQ